MAWYDSNGQDWLRGLSPCNFCRRFSNAGAIHRHNRRLPIFHRHNRRLPIYRRRALSFRRRLYLLHLSHRDRLQRPRQDNCTAQTVIRHMSPAILSAPVVVAHWHQLSNIVVTVTSRSNLVLPSAPNVAHRRSRRVLSRLRPFLIDPCHRHLRPIHHQHRLSRRSQPSHIRNRQRLCIHHQHSQHQRLCIHHLHNQHQHLRIRHHRSRQRRSIRHRQLRSIRHRLLRQQLRQSLPRLLLLLSLRSMYRPRLRIRR